MSAPPRLDRRVTGRQDRTASTGAMFGLLAPLTPVPPDAARPVDDGLVAAVDGAGLDALWLRDLPCVPVGDEDAGQGTDPFAHLSYLAGAGALPAVVGIASVVLGTRHPVVLARSVATAQLHTGARLVLGLGTGGKQAMNQALGVDGRSRGAVAQEWQRVRAAMSGSLGPDVRSGWPRTPAPEVYLATSDPERWRSIDGDADGWMAFLDDERAFERTHAAMEAVSGRPVPVAVRVDARIVPDGDAPACLEPDRGRVTGSLRQVGDLLARWRGGPVRHLMVNVRSADPLGDLVRLRDRSAG